VVLYWSRFIPAAVNRSIIIIIYLILFDDEFGFVTTQHQRLESRIIGCFELHLGPGQKHVGHGTLVVLFGHPLGVIPILVVYVPACVPKWRRVWYFKGRCVFKRTVITHNTGLKIMLHGVVIQNPLPPPTKNAYARCFIFSAPEPSDLDTSKKAISRVTI